ncbi:MAG TPA: hypothetical protein ENJ19_03550 [Gammaproteobacteria bacterium]|nr:hypothetical protein [Gammaproteobacteria bacterium]
MSEFLIRDNDALPPDGIPVLRDVVDIGEPASDAHDTATHWERAFRELAGRLQDKLLQDLEDQLDSTLADRLHDAVTEATAQIGEQLRSDLERRMGELVEELLQQRSENQT